MSKKGCGKIDSPTERRGKVEEGKHYNYDPVQDIPPNKQNMSE